MPMTTLGPGALEAASRAQVDLASPVLPLEVATCMVTDRADLGSSPSVVPRGRTER